MANTILLMEDEYNYLVAIARAAYMLCQSNHFNALSLFQPESQQDLQYFLTCQHNLNNAVDEAEEYLTDSGII